MKDNLFIYLRVSSDVQLSDGFGYENQKEKGLGLAKRLKMKPVLLDEGSKSSHSDFVSERPVLLKLLDDMGKGLVKHLWVYQMDRLSRNENVSFQIKKVIQQNGVRLYVGDGTEYSLDNPNDKLMFSLMDSISEFDNSVRTERLRRGKLSKVKSGGWKGGPPPYGFEIIDGKLSPHKVEKRWVKRIFDWYLEGKSIYQIQLQLQKNGVLSRRGLVVWNTNSVINILENNTHYEGYSTYTDHKLNETVITHNPPILSSTLIKKVRDRFTLRVNKSNYVKHTTLLRGYLVCGHCGHSLGQKINKQRYENHYLCRGNIDGRRSKPIGSPKICKTDIDSVRVRSLNIPDTDDYVWNTVLDVLSKSHLYKEIFKSTNLETAVSPKERNNNIQMLRRRNKAIDKQIKDITDSRNSFIVDSSSLPLSKTELKSLLVKFEDKKSELMVQRESILNEIQSSKTKDVWIDWVKNFGNKIEDLRNTEMSVEDKSIFLNGLIKNIVVKTIDNHTHSLDIHFKHNYINDGFEWKFKKVNGKHKKDGYTLSNGENHILGELVSVRTKKKNVNTMT